MSALSSRAIGIAFLAVVGLALAAPNRNSAQAPPPYVNAPGYGSVTGYLDACSGLGLATLQSPYAAGTVTALSGHIRWVAVAPGQWRESIPTIVTARSVVTPELPFRFVLPSGGYVLRGSYGPGSDVFPTVSVVVRAGRTIQLNIPDECK